MHSMSFDPLHYNTIIYISHYTGNTFDFFVLISFFSIRLIRHLLPYLIKIIGRMFDTTSIIDIVKHVHCTPMPWIPNSTVAVAIALQHDIKNHTLQSYTYTYAKLQRTRLLVAVIDELSSGNRSTANVCIVLNIPVWVKQTIKHA